MRVPSILPLAVSGLRFEAGGRRLIDDVGFTLRAGRRSVILGPNGAGKSLTLRICHGLLRPTAGTVRWQGGVDARARQAMVFQRPVMLRRTAWANLSYALSVRGVPRRERAGRIAEALRRTGLLDIARTPARLLSVGEQQRLALARAWLLEPEVLFLDEPTASLDPSATRAVEAIIQAIHAAGAKIVLTTQDMGQARRLGDEVLFLYGGRLLEHAPAERFFETPATPQARAFVNGELYDDWN
jgi:tungstate transport system ATP-binding protein